MFVPTYHLRRVNPKSHNSEELILLGEVTKFGRNADNVDVVLTSAVYSNMISRDHAVIMGKVDQNTRQIVGYKIRDNSLNGTYIDDKRVKDEMVLEDSSVIKFGHMNGAAIKAGAAAPQANAEFSFVFEKCTPNNRRYIGWEGYERRKTVVCTGDGKFMTETGEDHRTKKKPPPKEPVSSTTAPLPAVAPSFPIQQVQPTSTPATFGAPPPTVQPTDNPLYQMMQSQKMNNPFGMPGHIQFNHPALFQQHQQLSGYQAGLRPNGQYPPGMHPMHPPAGIHPMTHQQPIPIAQPIMHPMPHLLRMDGKPSSSTAPIRSPPVECDSSVPSPPKNGVVETRTGNADSSSQHSPRRGKDDDEDSFSVPDSPPRAPRPLDVPGRSVTNSPAPPSPRPVEKVEPPKVEKKKTVSPKKPVVNPGKVPKSGGGVTKKKNNEVDRLLTDLTEGSFMMEARRKSVGGAGSERRKMLNEGKKTAKRVASKNKLHRQLSSASSDEESDDDEASGVPIRSSTVSRPSMVGKKASSSTSIQKGVMKRSGGPSKGKNEESEESDPYEETDEESEGEMKNGKRKMHKKSSVVKKEKAIPKKTPKKKVGKKKKKKDSDESSASDNEIDDVIEKKEDKNDDEDFVDTENTKCGSAMCKLPKQSDVHWVECDGCKTWYHNFCVFNQNIAFKGKVFYCGCDCNPAYKKKRKS